MAMNEAKIIMSEFLTRYDFEVEKGYEWKLNFRLLYESDKAMMVNLKKRE